MHRIVAVVAAICLTQTACFGSFAAVRKLHSFNKGISGDKWLQELLFLAFLIVPVYSLFALGDILLFNSIEFWGGSNPVADGADWEQEREIMLADGSTAKLIRESADVMRIETAERTFHVERTPGGMRLLLEGEVFSEVREGTQGGLESIDVTGVRTVSAAELAGAGSDPASITAWAAARGAEMQGVAALR